MYPMHKIKPSAAPLSKADMIAYFQSGEKPKKDWKIGVEFERFAFDRSNFSPIAYLGRKSVLAIFDGLIKQYGWQPVYEGENIVALKREEQSITLEPGGQIELSGATQKSIHDCCAEITRHLAETAAVAEDLDIGFLNIGFHPTGARQDFDWVPKQRYRIMRDYMPKVGHLGLDMMLRTATVQVNLDFESESDMVKKLRVGLALQPIIGAMFANSPFTEGKINGYQSFRNQVWRDTDPARTGGLEFAFDDGMGYERYVDYVLDVPMYFVLRGGKYIDTAGESFRDFTLGKLSALPGDYAVIEDFANHATTVFPNVRLKRWLEMRGADGGDWGCLCALPALWTGLLYDDTALNAAYDIIRIWKKEDRDYLNAQSPKTGLATKLGSVKIAEIARKVLEIADDGLKRRNAKNGAGQDESHFLSSLWDIVTIGKSPADKLLNKFQGEWQGDIQNIFKSGIKNP